VRLNAIILSVSLMGFFAPALIANPDPCSIMLEQAGVNLNKAIQDGKIKPGVGSQAAAKQILNQILYQDRKPRILVKGNKGVGKTTQVDTALTLLPPNYLKVELDIRAMRVAANGSEAKFIEDLKKFLKETTKKAAGLPAIVFVVRDVEALTWKPRDAATQSSLNEYLKFESEFRQTGGPRLILVAEGETFDVNKMLGSDRNEFNVIDLPPASPADSLEIVKAYAAELAKKKGIAISPEAVARAVAIADNTSLPNSALQLISDATTKRQSSSNEGVAVNVNSAVQLQSLNAELAPLLREDAEHRANKERLEKKKQEEDRLNPVDNNSLVTALSKLKPESDLQLKIKSLRDKIASVSAQVLTVSANDVDTVYREKTGKGGRTGDLSNDPEYRKRARNSRDIIGKKVVGQPRAVEVAEAVAVSFTSGAKRPGRPRAVILFYGPTRTGKTLLAREMGSFIFGSKAAVRKFDGTDYESEIAGASLTGAHPGYVGYEEGGKLTNALLEDPERFIIFDELEKFHPRVILKLLPVLDVGGPGYIEDNHGRHAMVDQAIFGMTTNFGVELIQRELEAFKAPFKEKLVKFVEKINKKQQSITVTKNIMMSWESLLNLTKLETEGSISAEDKARLESLRKELGEWPAPGGVGPLEYYGNDIKQLETELNELRTQRKALEKEMIDAAAKSETIDSAEFTEKFKDAMRAARRPDGTPMFPPEFISRIDYFVPFRPFSLEGLKMIADLDIQEQKQLFKDKDGFDVELDDGVVEFLAGFRYIEAAGAKNIIDNVRDVYTQPITILQAQEDFKADFAGGKVKVEAVDEDTIVYTLMNKDGRVLQTARLKRNPENPDVFEFYTDWNNKRHYTISYVAPRIADPVVGGSSSSGSGASSLPPELLRELQSRSATPAPAPQPQPQTGNVIPGVIGFQNGQIVGPGFGDGSGMMLGDPAASPPAPPPAGQ